MHTLNIFLFIFSYDELGKNNLFSNNFNPLYCYSGFLFTFK